MSKLLEEVRNTLRVHHYALKTEKSYVQWIKRFILFQNRGALGARSPLDHF